MDESLVSKQGKKQSALMMEKSRSYQKQVDSRPSSLLRDRNEESKGRQKQVKFGDKVKHHQTEVQDRRSLRQEASNGGKKDKN